MAKRLNAAPITRKPPAQGRLQDAIARINPDIPEQAQEEALRKMTRLGKPSLLLNNHAFHHMLVNGIEVDYKSCGPKTGAWSAGGSMWWISRTSRTTTGWSSINTRWKPPHQNGKVNRRPDVVIFVNGLPLAVIELKNAADEKATIWSAFNQLQTYKNDIPALFHYNELLIISDGLNARIGSLTANKEWFLPWKTSKAKAPRLLRSHNWKCY
jgi:type I restriction enzyme, R subunit